MTVVPGDRVFRTINLNVNFIRVGRAHPVEIEAVVVAQTERVLTVRATLKREDGELIADASAQQTLQSSEEIRTRNAAVAPNNAQEPPA
jgi:acyl-coenzyme A thioesterase PaaI-like protein